MYFVCGSAFSDCAGAVQVPALPAWAAIALYPARMIAPAPATVLSKPTVSAWLVTDGASGNLRQAQALVIAMGLNAREITIELAAPWSWLGPGARRTARLALPSAFRAAAAEQAPQIVIGCGRRAALASAWLREHFASFAVQILDPRCDPSRWDVVIAPTHDRLLGDNVLNMTGALHAVTGHALAQAALRHADLAQIPTPRTAVLIGGPTRAQRIDVRYIDDLVERVASWCSHDGGGFLVTASRRTPPKVAAHLRAQFAQLPSRVWCDESDGENPYLGMLAHASRIVVTPDSANLMAEACATGKPVFVHAPHSVRGKLGDLHHELSVAGRVRPLRHQPMAWQTPPPLREAASIGAEVWRRYWAAQASG